MTESRTDTVYPRSASCFAGSPKKITFHTKNKAGKSKCQKMHIGKENVDCPMLKVHGTEMSTVEEQTYLGDIVSSNGKNIANINARVSKGMGITSQILSLLKELNNGQYYFKTALMLREAMLINGVLYNSEAWHNFTEWDINELEKVDRNFLKKLASNSSFNAEREPLS